MSRPTGRIGPGAAPHVVSGPNPPGTEELAKAIAEENYWDWPAEDVRRGCRRLARKYLAVIEPVLTGKQLPAEPLEIDQPNEQGVTPLDEAVVEDMKAVEPQGDVVEVLARFEFERLERESDLKIVGSPLPWERAEQHVREELLTWAQEALAAITPLLYKRIVAEAAPHLRKQGAEEAEKRCKEVEVESAEMVDRTVDLWVDRLRGFVGRLEAEVKSRMQRQGRNSSVTYADFKEAVEKAKAEVTALDWDTPARIDQALAKGAEEERRRLLGQLVEGEQTWPPAMSDGLSLPCGDCGNIPSFDYRVADDFWRRRVPEDDKRLGVICLPCLDKRSGGDGLADALQMIQWCGTEHTVELTPSRLVVYEYFGDRPSRVIRTALALAQGAEEYLERLRAASVILRKRSEHEPGCATESDQRARCSCGLDEALAALDTSAPSEEDDRG